MMTDDKIELLETVEGEEMRRYGMLICDVLLDIAQGCWIGESLLRDDGATPRSTREC